MRNIRSLIASGAIVFAAAGCSASGTNPISPTQANVSSNVLQFAVGTANVFGTPGSLNVVATYRQPTGGFAPGDSGALLDTPTLTLPAPISATAATTGAGYDGVSTILAGPSSSEVGTPKITSDSQNPGVACATALTTFGQSGGVFGLGIEPYNATGQADCTPPGAGSTGTPFQVAPYPIPLYDTVSPDANALVPWGGPPAFELAGNPDSVVGTSANLYPAGTAGVSEGIDVFSGIAPAAGGGYTLAVAVPSTSVTQKAGFKLPGTLTTLGTATSPAYTPNGSGGGTFGFAMPTGATEAYVEVVDYGPAQPAAPAAGLTSCNGWASAGTPVYYTLETTGSGTLTLPSTIGPTAPSAVFATGAAAGTVPSVCTAAQNTTANAGTATTDDQIAIQVIGFDYPAFESSYPHSLGNPSPAIVGPNGEDDITISAATCQAGATSCTSSLPLLRRRTAELQKPGLVIRQR